MLDELQKYIESKGIEFFNAKEITLHRRIGEHIVPEKNLWSNVDPTLQFADELRKRLAGPVIVVSGYRSPSYNEATEGAVSESEHTNFRALDLRHGNHFRLVYEALRLAAEYQTKGFEVGIGIYRTFIHVDVGAGRGQRFWIG